MKLVHLPLVLLLAPASVDAFVGSHRGWVTPQLRSVGPLSVVSSSALDGTPSAVPIPSENDPSQQESHQPQAVRAPLKFVGPYPTLSLRFPLLSTQSQKSRNVTGVSLDFVLDTAANTNTLNAQVASELGLEVVGKALPGVNAGGAMEGGNTFLLGECELEGLNEDEPFTFMTNLTASALPVASPAAAGLFGCFFLNNFPGGVEFQWGRPPSAGREGGGGGVPPSVTFYGDTNGMDFLQDMDRAEVRPLPGSYLPSVTVRINGVEIPALLDTGSPVTVLNGAAARKAGVETMNLEKKETTNNPFARLTQGFKSAQAAARGDVLLLAGANGPLELVKTSNPVDIAVEETSFGEGTIYVGDLPGLAALGGLGGPDAPPAVVLGMDVLRTKERMVYREREVYF